MRIKLLSAAALAVTAIGAAPAFAQDTAAPAPEAAPVSSNGTSFRGFRLEGDVGGDRFQSQGRHTDKFGYGGTIGFDGVINDRIVIGPEASYWRANNWSENCTGITGGRLCDKSFEEAAVGVRAGYLLSPQFLVYGKAGYAMNDQRKRIDTTAGRTVLYSHGVSDGYQVGGGVEYTLSKADARLPLYVGAQYVYSQYNDHTSRQRLMGSVGVRFK